MNKEDLLRYRELQSEGAGRKGYVEREEGVINMEDLVRYTQPRGRG